jgi:type IV pilus assembly protein PilW
MRGAALYHMNSSLPPERGFYRMAGMSLVELIIALALGVMLTGGAAGMYLASKYQFQREDQLARIQENGRYATRLLGRELSMSGFYGGLLSTASLHAVRAGVDCNSGAWALDSNEPLELVDDHVGAGVPTTVVGTPFTCVDGSTVVPNTDLLAIKRTASEASVSNGLVHPELAASSTTSWFLHTDAGLRPVWEQHRPSNFLAGGGLDSSASYWEASARIFYIRAYSRFPGDGVPSLCMELLAGDAMGTRCLVEGVEEMQVEFGIDSNLDGAVDRYLNNPSRAELRLARVARVYLLVRSLKQLPGFIDNGVYELGTREVDGAGDGYLRRVFTATAALRSAGDARFAGAYE